MQQTAIRQTQKHLAALNTAAARDPDAAAAAIRECRRILNDDPERRAWADTPTAARRFYLASAGLPEIKARWQWTDLAPSERTQIRMAAERAAALANIFIERMRGQA